MHGNLGVGLALTPWCSWMILFAMDFFFPHFLSQKKLKEKLISFVDQKLLTNFGPFFFYFYMLSNCLAINQGLPFDTHQKKRKKKFSQFGLLFMFYVCQRERKRIRLAFFGWSRSNLVGFWCPQIKSGHPQMASFGCCALLMDEQTFSWEFLHWRERRRIRVARGRIP